MALRKVFREPLMSSTKGSLMGYLREPHSTECSRMWGMPVELAGGVRRVTPKHLFSSSLLRLMTSAPVLVWRKKNTLESYSAT